LNAVDKFNSTALHHTALDGHADVAKVLLENGADVNAVSEDKSTALHFTAEFGHADVAKVLLQNGTKVNAVTTDGKTALYIACRDGYVDVVKVLIQNGADVNAVCKDKGTALRIAAVKDNIPCTLQLLCFGAEIDEQTIEKDKTKLLRPIEGRLKLLRNGNRIGTSLMSDEERRFMWDLGFVLAVQHPAIAFTTFQRIRSFVTFHGIFMGPGYCLGKGSVWSVCRASVSQLRPDHEGRCVIV
jgi:ankyrin repeat protein